MTKPIMALLIGIAVVVPGLTAAVVVADLPEESKAEVTAALGAQLPVLMLGLLALVGAIAALSWWVRRRENITDQVLAADITTITEADSSHRVSGSSAVAGAVNDLAAHYHRAEQRLEAALAAAHTELRRERDALVAVLAGLDVPVAVIDAQGRLLLVNPAARRALAGGRARPPAAGRSIFSVFDAEDFTPVLARALAGERLSAAVANIPIRLVRITGEDEPAAILIVGDPGDPATPAGPRIGLSSDLARPSRSMLSREAWLEGKLADIVFTVVDCETTGLHSAAGDRLVAVAAVRVDGAVVRAEDTFDELVNPRRAIPAVAIDIHGITDAMVADARSAAEVVADFADYAESSVLVGHHLGFDLGFLSPAAAKAGVDLEPFTLDTMLLSAVLFTEPGARHGLDAVSRRLGVDVVGRHTALGDALATAEVLVRMIPLLAKRGIVTLGQARKASQGTDFARRIAEGA
jgi:DNA polymerase III epsilon subunit family exonuclease